MLLKIYVDEGYGGWTPGYYYGSNTTTCYVDYCRVTQCNNGDITINQRSHAADKEDPSEWTDAWTYSMVHERPTSSTDWRRWGWWFKPWGRPS